MPGAIPRALGARCDAHGAAAAHRYTHEVDRLRVALAQMAPRLGVVDENVARHVELLGEARAQGADLAVFPQLGLTGYLLQDLNADVAIRLDDPRLVDLARAAGGLSAGGSLLQENGDQPLFIAPALPEGGA